jgi:hypothetical protein
MQIAVLLSVYSEFMRAAAHWSREHPEWLVVAALVTAAAVGFRRPRLVTRLPHGDYFPVAFIVPVLVAGLAMLLGTIIGAVCGDSVAGLVVGLWVSVFLDLIVVLTGRDDLQR